MKVRILSTKEAPSLFRRVMGQVLRGPAPKISIARSQVPYWQERGWRREGRNYRGTYKTAYGSFLGLIEEVRPGNYRLYIYDPPQPLRSHSHWTCFQDLGSGSFRIHMARMPRDVGSGILGIERLLTEAFEGR
ncbi:MAG: hypothetical protein WAU45_02045 [Blastocatellia bacterium]